MRVLGWARSLRRAPPAEAAPPSRVQQSQQLGYGVEPASDVDFPTPPLPAGLRTIEIADWSDKSRFRLVVADPPTRFDELVLPNPNVSPLAVLLKKVLAGGGTLLDFGAHIGTVALPVALAGR